MQLLSDTFLTTCMLYMARSRQRISLQLVGIVLGFLSRGLHCSGTLDTFVFIITFIGRVLCSWLV